MNIFCPIVLFLSTTIAVGLMIYGGGYVLIKTRR